MSNTEHRTGALDGLVTDDALAADLDVDPRTVDRYTKRPVDPLPFLKVGLRKYFDVEVVRKWIMRQKGSPEIVPRKTPMKSQTTAKRGRGRPRKDEQRAAE